MSIQEYINHQWETGDKVVSEYYGLGEVIEILPCDEPNIRVKFTNGIVKDFYRNGDSIKTSPSDRVGIRWYNESKGIQHCIIVDNNIHTIDTFDIEIVDAIEDGVEYQNAWFLYNDKLNELHPIVSQD